MKASTTCHWLRWSYCAGVEHKISEAPRLNMDKVEQDWAAMLKTVAIWHSDLMESESEPDLLLVF